MQSLQCETCPDYDADKPTQPLGLKLINRLSPGDALVMSAAIEMIHQQYPGEYATDVESPVPAIWENNPHITPSLQIDRVIEMQYPLINRSDAEMVPFLRGYVDYLGEQIGRPLRLTTNRPHLYLSDQEKYWVSQVHELTGRAGRFWLINAGVKRDFTAKNWGRTNYQEVVNRLRHIQFVQIGAAEHDHPPLDNVIDLRGKTDTRQLIRLAWHAAGGVGPSTFLQHLCAAWQKPYVCLLGGREPVSWVQYPKQTTLHTIGMLSCCRDRACWKSRVVPLNDGADADKSLCEFPMVGTEAIPKCLAIITPAEVAGVIAKYESER